ncbi:hypothetical protein CR513_51154, partial [Mucuna pruriens]
MEVGDTLVQFNIFEAMKHPTEDHSLFGIDTSGEDISNFAGDTEVFNCLVSVIDEAECDNLWKVHDLSSSEDDNIDLADLSQEAELLKLVDQLCKHEDLECSNNIEVQVAKTKKLFSTQNHVPSGSDSSTRQNVESDSNPIRVDSIPKLKAKIMSTHLVSNSNQASQLVPKATNDNSSPPPPVEMKPLPSHLKYAYLNTEQQLLEQEDKLLHILREHKKAIGWKLSDLLGINPSTYLHRILMEEEA